MLLTEEKPDLAPADAALLALARAVRDTGYRFTTVTPLTHSRVNARGGNARAWNLAGVFGWSRPFGGDTVPAPLLGLMRDAGVLIPEDGGFRSTVRLSTLGNNLFLHSAYPTTGTEAVFFGPDTYRFARAIQAHLRERRDALRRAIDIGCGAGPGGILVAGAAPDAAVLMVDINETALRFARLNTALNGATGVAICRSDLLGDVEGVFDLIVSNPPYLIDPAGRAYRHGGGSWGEGLSLAILDAALDRLAPGGTLVLYTGSAIVAGADPFLAACTARLRGTRAAWSYVEVDPDVFGEELETGAYTDVDRIAAVVLNVTGEP